MDDARNVSENYTNKLVSTVAYAQISSAEDVLVRRTLMRRSAPQPRSRKTPSGGRRIARMILMISLYTLSAFCEAHESRDEIRLLPMSFTSFFSRSFLGVC